MRSKHVRVQIDLDQVCRNAEQIRRTTRVSLIAVIKADAYGLGAPAVAKALSGIADEFAYFSLDEAHEVGMPGLVLGPPQEAPDEYAALSLRPTVFSLDQAARFRKQLVTVSVDTGMQRFGCPMERADELIAACRAADLMTHAAGPAAAAMLLEVNARHGLRLHAASSSLLTNPETWLDAVRPGVALYRGAVRVSTRLYSVRNTYGPAGYTGFRHPRVGIILAGYSNFVPAGPVTVNGRRQRLLEVGMNTAFVSVDPSDAAGDEVVLLGDGLNEAELAAHLNVREHEVLCRYTAIGERSYLGETQRRVMREPTLTMAGRR